jgi:uncharacterized membrane protein (UPF0182 family)
MIFVVAAVALGLGSSFLVDWLWFSTVGYFAVFRTMFVAKAIVAFLAFVASGLCFAASGLLALRFTSPRTSPFPYAVGGSQTLRDLLEGAVSNAALARLLLIASLGLALLVALIEADNWGTALRFIHQVRYGETDPIFDKDIGFYLFSMPAYLSLLRWLFAILFLSALIAGAIYWLRGDASFDMRLQVSPAFIRHGSVMLGLFFALEAWSYYLDRYMLLFGDNTVLFGANYADIRLSLPIIWLLVGLMLCASLALFLNVRWRTHRTIVVAVLGFFGTLIAAPAMQALFEQLYVKPNELALETPYLQNNIELTQEAYGLRNVTVRPFPVEQKLTLKSLDTDRGTVENIRLWDWRPLMDTYAQLQEIRTYYKFYDVDVDRYNLDGTYQQVTLAARELDSRLLPPNAQTWVNLHLIFTHGDGVVMSPVTQKTPEGLPIFYEHDVPPTASGGPVISNPRIYFGEGPQPYVIVGTNIQEFDYPQGSVNSYTTYSGADGVSIGGLALRTLFAWHFDDANILLSRYITPRSRIVFRRNIQERIETIAPFLRLDRDPYIVVSNGRLFWVQDAYTTSSWFPYSQPASDGANYIRNSVKVVVDAYNGTVEFYEVDATDPVLATYRGIFPEMFKPLASMPDDLRKHIRYPEDLFHIQADMYRAYHMSAPEVFYNREDLWQFPRQTSSVGEVPSDRHAAMAPYYMIMRLPEEARAAYFLLVPMVPNRRDNMIAWIAAACDPADYGKLIVYEFPKEKQVFGPFQIEARINQNTEISQQISLWNQMGSRVIRGDILVIPIETSILYVSPLYLRAETGQLPELKRVIAAYQDGVVMTDTLPEALSALFKEGRAPAPAIATTSPSVPLASPSSGDAVAALDAYNRAIDRLRAGDWSGFGAALDTLRSTLERLAGEQKH